MRKRYLIIGLAAFGVLLAALAGNTARNVVRWQPLTRSPQDITALLAPDWHLITPQGAGPFKAAVLMSGCDGVHDNMMLWADQMVSQGRAALIVDSHGPRGLDQLQSWRAVCAAQILPGAERAGDIAVAIAALAKMPQIDTTDLAILGASHGGWAAMELMDLLGHEAPPPGLTEWPIPRRVLAAKIGPVVLLYPYCGVISGAGKTAWPDQARGLMILAENDNIVDPAKCRDMAKELAGLGTKLSVQTLAGADHGFDQKEHSAISPLKYEPLSTELAIALVTQFLTQSPGVSPIGPRAEGDFQDQSG